MSLGWAAAGGRTVCARFGPVFGEGLPIPAGSVVMFRARCTLTLHIVNVHGPVKFFCNALYTGPPIGYKKRSEPPIVTRYRFPL